MNTSATQAEPNDDAALLLRAQAGDLVAAGDYLAPRLTSLAAIARKRAAGSIDADDLLADSITRLLESWQQGKGPTGNVVAYLSTMMRNRVIDEVRTPRFQRTEYDVELDLVGTDDEALDRVDYADDLKLVGRALERLSEDQQRVLCRAVIEGAKPGDLTTEFDRPAPAISSLLARAKRSLKRALLIETIATHSPNGCQKWGSQLPESLPAELDGSASNSAWQHVSTCEHCLDAYSRYEQVAQTVQSRMVVLGALGLVPGFAPGIALGGSAGAEGSSSSSSANSAGTAGAAGVSATTGGAGSSGGSGSSGGVSGGVAPLVAAASSAGAAPNSDTPGSGASSNSANTSAANSSTNGASEGVGNDGNNAGGTSGPGGLTGAAASVGATATSTWSKVLLATSIALTVAAAVFVITNGSEAWNALRNWVTNSEPQETVVENLALDSQSLWDGSVATVTSQLPTGDWVIDRFVLVLSNGVSLAHPPTGWDCSGVSTQVTCTSTEQNSLPAVQLFVEEGASSPTYEIGVLLKGESKQYTSTFKGYVY